MRFGPLCPRTTREDGICVVVAKSHQIGGVPSTSPWTPLGAGTDIGNGTGGNLFREHVICIHLRTSPVPSLPLAKYALRQFQTSGHGHRSAKLRVMRSENYRASEIVERFNQPPLERRREVHCRLIQDQDIPVV